MHTLKNCLKNKKGTSNVIRNVTSISRAKIVFRGKKLDFSTRVRFKESGYTHLTPCFTTLPFEFQLLRGHQEQNMYASV